MTQSLITSAAVHTPVIMPDFDEFVGQSACMQKLYAMIAAAANGTEAVYGVNTGFGKLASTLVRLNKFSEAVEAARKANYSRTWKEVLEACVDAKEFQLGQVCGLNLISNADEIEDVLKTYKRRGFFDQLITLMEAGVAATEAGGAGAAVAGAAVPLHR